MAAEEAAPVGEGGLEAAAEGGRVEVGDGGERVEVGEGALQAGALALAVLDGLHERGGLATAGGDGRSEVGELALDLAEGRVQAVALGCGRLGPEPARDAGLILDRGRPGTGGAADPRMTVKSKPGVAPGIFRCGEPAASADRPPGVEHVAHPHRVA